MYQVVVERSAEKDLKRLSAEIRARAVKAIQALAGNPRPGGGRKLTGSANDWRIRVGDYRIVYEIADQIRIVASTGSAIAAKFIANSNANCRSSSR